MPDTWFTLVGARRPLQHSTESRISADPWLIAQTGGGPSAATRSPSSMIGRGFRMLIDANFEPKSLAELAAAAATEELLAGRSWRQTARRLGLGTQDLNDNAAALLRLAWPPELSFEFTIGVPKSAESVV
ncbi:MAG: hypothetical protein R3F60_18640 [bacterium]